MTALSDALQTAQSAALAALARQYVRGPLGAHDDGTEALIASLERLGLDDLVDATRWVACLDVLRETGSRPPGENGSAQRREEPATDVQWQLIRRLADERTLAAPDGPLSKGQASQVIDELRDGKYDPDKWSVPF